MTKIVEVLNKYMGMTQRDKDDVEQYFAGINTDGLTLRRNVSATGGGSYYKDGNVDIDFADGITLYDPASGNRSIYLDPDGDAFFGSNIDEPGSTALAIFANKNVYNSNTYGAGDLLIGDDSDAMGNMWWDASVGKLYFRSGTTTSVEIGDGGIIATWGKIGGWNIGATSIYDDGSDIVLDSTGGFIKVGSGANYIYIDGANDLIRSSNYSADTSGWQIDEVGNAEFNNITARGTLKSAVFEHGSISAVGGKIWVSKNAGTLTVPFTTGTAPEADMSITIKDSDAGNKAAEANDVLEMRTWNGTALVTAFLTVTAVGATSGGATTYTVDYESGNDDSLFVSGTAIVNLGPANAGVIEIAAGETTTKIRIFTHSGSPWSTYDAKVIIGNMRGTYNTGTNDRYGIGIGDYSTKNYLSYNAGVADQFILVAGDGGILLNENGFIAQSGSTWTVKIDTDGDAFFGSNINASATTAFAVFANAQTYNSESMGAGDVLFGDNSASKANIKWDKSDGKILFRKQTTVHTYIDTDGSFSAGSGGVYMNEDGLFIQSSGVGYESDKALTFKSAGGDVHGQMYAYAGGAGANYLYIVAPEITDENNDLYLIASEGDVVLQGNDVFSVEWTDYSTSSTITGWASFTEKTIEYKKIGNLVYVNFRIGGTSGGTDGTVARFTLPEAEGQTGSPLFFIYAKNNSGTPVASFAQMTGSTVTCQVAMAGGLWTASGTKAVYGQFCYQST